MTATQPKLKLEFRLYGSSGTFHQAAATDINGLNSLQISARSTGGCHYQVSASTTLTVRGTFAAHLEKYLKKDINACTNAIECRLYDCQCEKYHAYYYYIDTNTPLNDSRVLSEPYSQCTLDALENVGIVPGTSTGQVFYNAPTYVNKDLNVCSENRYQPFKCLDTKENYTDCKEGKHKCTTSILNCNCEMFTKFGLFEGSTNGIPIDYEVTLPDGQTACIDELTFDYSDNTILLTLLK